MLVVMCRLGLLDFFVSVIRKFSKSLKGRVVMVSDMVIMILKVMVLF